jgi:hypothetical protein
MGLSSSRLGVLERADAPKAEHERQVQREAGHPLAFVDGYD